jgi:hypothetical protein
MSEPISERTGIGAMIVHGNRKNILVSFPVSCSSSSLTAQVPFVPFLYHVSYFSSQIAFYPADEGSSLLRKADIYLTKNYVISQKRGIIIFTVVRNFHTEIQFPGKTKGFRKIHICMGSSLFTNTKQEVLRRTNMSVW